MSNMGNKLMMTLTPCDRMDIGSVTLDPIYITEQVDSVVRFTFGGDTGFGRRFLDPKADENFPREEIFCSPDAMIDCNDPLPGSKTLFTWIKPYFANSDYQVSRLCHFLCAKHILKHETNLLFVLYAVKGGKP